MNNIILHLVKYKMFFVVLNFDIPIGEGYNLYKYLSLSSDDSRTPYHRITPRPHLHSTIRSRVIFTSTDEDHPRQDNKSHTRKHHSLPKTSRCDTKNYHTSRSDPYYKYHSYIITDSQSLRISHDTYHPQDHPYPILKYHKYPKRHPLIHQYPTRKSKDRTRASICSSPLGFWERTF